MHDDLAQPFDLTGRVAVVTGAASGIGQEVARVLALAGAAVVAADIDEDGLTKTIADVAALGGRAVAHATDVGDRAAVETLADRATEAFGALDIWVNAAAILVTGRIVDTGQDELQRMLSVNLAGTYWCCAAAARRMKGRGGTIVNFSSTGADTPVPELSLYSVTKAAVNMLTRTAAAEFGADGIRVNAVAPGFVDTPMVAYRYRDANGGVDEGLREALLQSRAAGSPLGRTGTPRDIALAVLYLASDAARFVTGQVLRANGGVSMP